MGLYLCAILSDGMTVVLFIFLEDGEHCRICLGKKGVITTYKWVNDMCLHVYTQPRKQSSCTILAEVY